MIDKGTGKSRQYQIERQKRYKQFGEDLPPVYPNGWFAVEESDKLKPGQVRAVTIFGKFETILYIPIYRVFQSICNFAIIKKTLKM